MNGPQNLSCERAFDYLPLYLYAELAGDEEESLEQHLHECAGCRAELERLKAFHHALEQAPAEIPAELLNRARAELARTLAAEQPRQGWAARLAAWRESWSAQSLWRPVGAMAMLVVGFWFGRAVPAERPVAPALTQAAMAEPVASRVRHVEPDGSGRLQIVVDETRQRILTGSPENEAIRQLLFAAALDPNDPGLRGESVDILRKVAPCDQTRQTLLRAVEKDPNDGVRLRALEGLRPYAKQADVRRVITQVLLRDQNAGVRTQAIDLLTQTRVDAPQEIQMVGVCQDLMQREANGYIRLQCQKRLRELKASEEVY
jgi:hypothetical protein